MVRDVEVLEKIVEDYIQRYGPNEHVFLAKDWPAHSKGEKISTNVIMLAKDIAQAPLLHQMIFVLGEIQDRLQPEDPDSLTQSFVDRAAVLYPAWAKPSNSSEERMSLFLELNNMLKHEVTQAGYVNSDIGKTVQDFRNSFSLETDISFESRLALNAHISIRFVELESYFQQKGGFALQNFSDREIYVKSENEAEAHRAKTDLIEEREFVKHLLTEGENAESILPSFKKQIFWTDNKAKDYVIQKLAEEEFISGVKSQSGITYRVLNSRKEEATIAAAGFLAEYKKGSRTSVISGKANNLSGTEPETTMPMEEPAIKTTINTT